MSFEHDPEYVETRRVLLDALTALGRHRKAIVLVGAQAIYLRVGAGNLLVAPFTSDGDLALHPDVLEDEPLLAEALAAAGFVLAVRAGTWARDAVQIDLMVPATLGGGGRRSARLGPHGKEVARKTAGLEAAMVDNEVYTLAALDPDDTRTVDEAGFARIGPDGGARHGGGAAAPEEAVRRSGGPRGRDGGSGQRGCRGSGDDRGLVRRACERPAEGVGAGRGARAATSQRHLTCHPQGFRGTLPGNGQPRNYRLST